MSMRTLGIMAGVMLVSLSTCQENSTKAPPSVQSKVVLTTFDPTLKWVPTQFAPKTVERQSVSAVDQWPTDGDTITILCSLGGEPDSLGDTSWYRIVVPAKYLNPGAKEQAVKAPGGYEAYLEAMWLPDAKNVSGCE